jgi:hypothetical protein
LRGDIPNIFWFSCSIPGSLIYYHEHGFDGFVYPSF